MRNEHKKYVNVSLKNEFQVNMVALTVEIVRGVIYHIIFSGNRGCCFQNHHKKHTRLNQHRTSGRDHYNLYN